METNSEGGVMSEAKHTPETVADSSEWLRDFAHSMDRCGVITEFELTAIRQIARKLNAWKLMAANLHGWEPIEAVRSGTGWDADKNESWSGPRREMPEGYIEVSNSSGVSADEWKVFCEANW